MKKSFNIMVIVCLIFLLTGCKKCISTEYENIEVTIVDEYHRRAYSTPRRIGKTTTMRVHPAVYRITVEYNSIKYTISGKNTYNKYKEKVGQTIFATLEVRTYDDGSVKYDITGLQ